MITTTTITIVRTILYLLPSQVPPRGMVTERSEPSERCRAYARTPAWHSCSLTSQGFRG